ncbi:hypothetical protein AAMO2058_000195800 [Amorphochlora amoebiformis]
MSQNISLSNPVFTAFATSGLLLALKSLGTNIWVLTLKLRSSTVHAPEDKPFFDKTLGKGKLMTPKTGFGCDDPNVKRGYAVIQNDSENFPMFYVVGGLYVATGGSSSLPFGMFTVARYLHTLFYAWGVNPLGFTRGALYFTGLGATIYMGVHVAKQINLGGIV